MPIGWLIAGSLVTGAIASNNAADAAKSAAETQATATEKSAGIGAEAAKAAAAGQVEAARLATEEQRRQFDISRTQAEPFRQAELDALQAGAPLRQAQRDFGINQIGLGQQQVSTAEQALDQSRALTGLSGVDAQKQAFDSLQASPGQDFLRQRGQQALLRSNAAIGGLGGGQVRSALQQQGIGFAQQDLQNQLARLASFGVAGGSGQTGQVNPLVQQNLAGLRSNFANNVGNLGISSAQAAGSGLIGAAQAQGQGLIGAAQARASGNLGAAQAQSQFLGQVGSGLLGGAIGAGTKDVGFARGAAAGLLGRF